MRDFSVSSCIISTRYIIVWHKFDGKHQQIICIPLFCHFHSLSLRHRSATTAVVRNDFNEKVLLKLSSLMKFSQNFSAVKVIAVAPHHGLYSHNWLYTYPWCGLIGNSQVIKILMLFIKNVWGARGRKFESCRPDQREALVLNKLLMLFLFISIKLFYVSPGQCPG